MNEQLIKDVLRWIITTKNTEMLDESDIDMVYKDYVNEKASMCDSEHIAPVVRSNATETTKYFWNCECERDYIHPRNTGFCDKCKTRREYQPNSRIDEVVKIMIAKG